MKKKKYLSEHRGREFLKSHIGLLFFQCFLSWKMNKQDMSSVNKAINSAFVDLKGISTSDGYKKAHENMKKAVSDDSAQ